MKKYRIIIAGGRDFIDYKLLDAKVRALIYKMNPEDVEIVCGGAKGADTLGERFADAHDIPVKYFYPNWDDHGKAAGHIRNRQMGDYGTHLIAFWDGKSKGTKGMIDYATSKGLQVRVIMYNTTRPKGSQSIKCESEQDTLKRWAERRK